MNKERVYIREIFNQYGFVPTFIRNIGFAICVSSICFNKKDSSNINKFFYSASAGLLGSFLTQPFDYIKTYQQQNNCNNTYEIIVKTYKENPLNFYSQILHLCLKTDSSLA